jgi:hypothetical protein
VSTEGEHSHRTDDKGFYLPLLIIMSDERTLLKRAAHWVYYCNVERAHSGQGMGRGSPWRKLGESVVKVPAECALLPPILLDRISTDWALGLGNDPLIHYKLHRNRGCRGYDRIFVQ